MTYDDLGVAIVQQHGNWHASTTVDLPETCAIEAMSHDPQDAVSALMHQLEGIETVLATLGKHDAAEVVSEFNAEVFAVWSDVERGQP